MRCQAEGVPNHPTTPQWLRRAADYKANLVLVGTGVVAHSRSATVAAPEQRN